jgi:acetyl esterase/lipase
MRIRKTAAGMALVFAGIAAPGGAAERPKVVKEAMTIESHRMVINKARTAQNPGKHVSLLMPVDVAVYRPDDGLKHPAIVYLHGGGMSFADPLMDRFHVELASRGLVVLAPHYLLNGTGWPHWHESAVNTVTLAASLPGVDPDHIGISGISMGGQIGLSTAARDPRIKVVAEYFTAWPGSLPDEPVAKLPPVLLLNGTADPIIPFSVALELDEILKQHKLPFERHVYEGLGHGFSTLASFKDGLTRTSAFFGGRVDEPEPTSTRVETTLLMSDQSGSVEGFFDFSDDDDLVAWPTATEISFAIFAPKAKPKRLVVKKPGTTRASSTSKNAAKP